MSIDRRDFLKTGAAGMAGTMLGDCRSHGAEQAAPHRYIDRSLCIGCASCVPLCPMGAISMIDEQSSIDADECAECGVCYRSRVCPVDAIKPGNLIWPRTLREVFSNPMTGHKSTGVAGRGTEETKTNDSTNRYPRGFIGVLIELGRPALGTRFYDVEKVVKKFKAHGFRLLDENPVAELINDKATAGLKPEILREKAISVLVEFILPDSAANELLRIIEELKNEVETVFNVSVALRARPDGSSPIDDLFDKNIFRLPNGKVNLGLAAGIAGKDI